MPAKNAKTESGGFSAEERAAMKERAAELRAEGKKGAKEATAHRRSSTGSRGWQLRTVRSPNACTRP
jgi:hypothetical protein